jgi:C1A family cysteine protease
MITFAIDQNFRNAGPGFIWNRYASSNGARHAVTICGYDDAKHAVKIMNSWGTGWGENGFSWIDYDFLRTLNPTVYVMNF